jgi:hypothetical protein
MMIAVKMGESTLFQSFRIEYYSSASLELHFRLSYLAC